MYLLVENRRVNVTMDHVPPFTGKGLLDTCSYIMAVHDLLVWKEEMSLEH